MRPDPETDFAEVLSPQSRKLARELLECADAKDLRLATAESCTGGLLSTLLTDLPGVNHCFECGFVVYSDEAKAKLLGVPRELIDEHGAVSRPVALDMAQRALRRCDAHFALSITGFAGPGGEGEEEGLVHIAVAGQGDVIRHEEHHFGAIGRDGVRTKALSAALHLFDEAIRAA